MKSETDHELVEVGIMQPHQMQIVKLSAGEVGYIFMSIMDVADARVGGMITTAVLYRDVAGNLLKENRGEVMAEI